MLRRQSAGRPLPQQPKGCGGGKSGLHRHTVPDNVRRGFALAQAEKAPGTVPQRTNRPAKPSRRSGVRVKRCGKSAPRLRQRRRHGKPHREQNRIGTATRAVRASENTAGQCQARRPGRLLEAMCKHCPRGMAVTYRPAQAGGALQNPAYRPADSSRMRGPAQHAGPLATWRTVINPILSRRAGAALLAP